MKDFMIIYFIIIILLWKAHMEQSIKELIKLNLWKTALKKI